MSSHTARLAGWSLKSTPIWRRITDNKTCSGHVGKWKWVLIVWLAFSQRSARVKLVVGFSAGCKGAWLFPCSARNDHDPTPTHSLSQPSRAGRAAGRISSTTPPQILLLILLSCRCTWFCACVQCTLIMF